MGYCIGSFRIKLFLIFLLNIVISNAQSTYSVDALTGKGDLLLVGNEFKLQKEAYEAFKKMQSEAIKDGIQIKILSSYRSYNKQKNIWNRKYSNYISKGLTSQQAIQKIIEYSTLPGTSRHHWGTDIDIVDGAVAIPQNSLTTKNYEPKGVFENLKKWMDSNSEKFGFYLVYTNNLERRGFKYEPWHYSYKGLSKTMLEDFLKINKDLLFQNTNLKGINSMSEEFISKYYLEHILDINTSLK